MAGALGGLIGSVVKTIFSVEYLVIAGGGPGGVAIGNYTNTGTGGGGAGGYLTATQPNFTLNESYTITIGAGASSNGLEVGSNSTFSSITANGGGGGGSSGGGSVPSMPSSQGQQEQAPLQQRFVNIGLSGSDNTMYTKDSVRELIKRLNEEVKDGAVLRVN